MIGAFIVRKSGFRQIDSESVYAGSDYDFDEIVEITYKIEKDSKEIGEMRYNKGGPLYGEMYGYQFSDLSKYRGESAKEKFHSFLKSKTGKKFLDRVTVS